MGVLQPQHDSSIQSLGSAPEMLAWRARGCNVRSLYGLMASLRIIVSSRAYATKWSRWSASMECEGEGVLYRPILAGPARCQFRSYWWRGTTEGLTPIMSPACHKLRSQRPVGHGDLPALYRKRVCVLHMAGNNGLQEASGTKWAVNQGEWSRGSSGPRRPNSV